MDEKKQQKQQKFQNKQQLKLPSKEVVAEATKSSTQTVTTASGSFKKSEATNKVVENTVEATKISN